MFLLGAALVAVWAYAVIDILTRPGMSRSTRVTWVLVTSIPPWLGGLVYVLVRPARAKPSPPAGRRAQPPEESVPEDPRAAEMDRILSLRAAGVLSDEEFEVAKAKLVPSLREMIDEEDG
ncbi:MAG TPA: SHOCT domain-containing protein [Thermoleophilia bacterium]